MTCHEIAFLTRPATRLLRFARNDNIFTVHPNDVDSPAALRDILTQGRTITMLGSKTGAQEAQAALELAAAGIRVVQDRCIMVDHRVLQ